MKQVTYGPYVVTVRKANVLDGIRRDQMIAKAFEQEHAADDDPLRTAAIVMYPSAASCSNLDCNEALPEGALDQDGRVSLEFFVGLPDDFVRAWLGVVFELNPHWNTLDNHSEAVVAEKKG